MNVIKKPPSACGPGGWSYLLSLKRISMLVSVTFAVMSSLAELLVIFLILFVLLRSHDLLKISVVVLTICDESPIGTIACQ